MKKGEAIVRPDLSGLLLQDKNLVNGFLHIVLVRVSKVSAPHPEVEQPSRVLEPLGLSGPPLCYNLAQV